MPIQIFSKALPAVSSSVTARAHWLIAGTRGKSCVCPVQGFKLSRGGGFKLKRSVTKPDEAFYFVMSEMKGTMDKQIYNMPRVWTFAVPSCGSKFFFRYFLESIIVLVTDGELCMFFGTI